MDEQTTFRGRGQLMTSYYFDDDDNPAKNLRRLNAEAERVRREREAEKTAEAAPPNNPEQRGNGSNGHDAPPALQIARAYIARGWNPLPVAFRGKRPLGEQWQARMIDETSAARFFNGAPLNIGVLLGPSSHGLTDVDLDSPESIIIASYLLPPTAAIFGRASKRASHRLYYCGLSEQLEDAAIQLQAPDGAMLLELRIGGGGKGAQTVFPGSLHESGEPIVWEEDGEPPSIDGTELLTAVRRIGAACLIARAWPAEGGRHGAALVLGGFLARAGLAEEQIKLMAEAIARAAGDPEWRDRMRAALDAAREHRDGGRSAGLPKIAELVGDKAARRIADWLDYRDAEREHRGNGHDDYHHDDHAQAHSQADKSSGLGEWPDPDYSMLDDRRGDLPEFPDDVFRGPCQQWLEEAAHASGVTPAHVAVPLLGVASGLIGTARRVRPTKSWSQPMTLWTALVGFSGTGKTPGIDATKNVLSQIERDRRDRIARLKHAHEERAAAAKAAQKKWREEVEAAVKGGSTPPAMPLEAMVPDGFVAPRLYVTNATIERLAVLLQAKPRGGLYLADELSALFANMGRYSNGRDDQFWLEAWAGGRYVVERMNRDPVIVDRLLLGLVGGFQPDALARSFAGDQTGMYSRFLFGWATEPRYRLLADTLEEMHPDIINALTRLVDLPAEEDGQLLQTCVPLTRQALAIFEDFRRANFEARADRDGRDREYLAKGPAQVLRLAGTLAYLGWAFTGGPEPEWIDEEFMSAAVSAWDRYFWPHAQAALRMIGLTDRHADARRVLRWIKAHRRAEISREEARRDALTRRLDAEGTEAVLMALVKAGWLRRAAVEGGVNRGWPALWWAANPRLFGAAEIPEFP
jgi:hypothetical protein